MGRETGEEKIVGIGTLREDERMGTLAAALCVLDREGDIWKAAKDRKYRDKLYKEFGLDYSA